MNDMKFHDGRAITTMQGIVDFVGTQKDSDGKVHYNAELLGILKERGLTIEEWCLVVEEDYDDTPYQVGEIVEAMRPDGSETFFVRITGISARGRINKKRVQYICKYEEVQMSE